MASCSSLCCHFSAIFCFEKCCTCCIPGDVPYLPRHLGITFVDKILHQGTKPVLDSKSKVTGLEAKAFGLGDGMLSQMYRLSLEYKPKNAGPKTIVAKVTPENVKMRLFGSILDLYMYEDAFYRLNIGKKLGLNTPMCYYTGLGDYGRYCILLSDFAPAKSENQIKGLRPDLVSEALSQIAKLHAKYRGQVATSVDTKEWILRQNNIKFYDTCLKTFAKNFQGCDQAYPKLGMSSDQAMPAHSLALFMATNLNFFKRLYTEVFNSAFPTTFCHGDYRAENMLFPQDNLKQFMLFDFQIVKETNGLLDVVYLMFSSMQPGVRKANERQLLKTYYDAMHKLGANDLAWAEVLLMYGLGISMCAIFAYISLQDLFDGPNANDPKTMAFQKSYIVNLAALATDWNALAMLKKCKLHLSNSPNWPKFTKFSPGDYRDMIPKRYHDLLNGQIADQKTTALGVALSASTAPAIAAVEPALRCADGFVEKKKKLSATIAAAVSPKV